MLAGVVSGAEDWDRRRACRPGHRASAASSSTVAVRWVGLLAKASGHGAGTRPRPTGRILRPHASVQLVSIDVDGA